MRKGVLAVWYVCWHAVISVEFLVLLVAVCMYWQCSLVRDLFASVMVSDELAIVLMGMSVAVSVWIFNEVRKVWWPDVKDKTILINWPNYFRVKCCCVIACCYAFLSSVLAIAGTVFKDCLAVGMGLYLEIVALLIALVDGASCWLASLTLHQILEAPNKANMEG